MIEKIKTLLIGKALNPFGKGIFHSLTLTALLAWIGFGVDGISSSSYGPSEAYLELLEHPSLSVLVAILMVVTIFLISRSYIEIIELFPSGGGGYVVASKLLSPGVGMVSGTALVIDYVLTINVSVVAGVAAIFSFLPASWQGHSLQVSAFGIIFLIILNLRGVKESVLPLIPVFILFLGTHLWVLGYSFFTHLGDLPKLVTETHQDFTQSLHTLGILGVGYLILHAYSMGSGTYTGIEAVSNGLPLIREPRVENAKKTTWYMAGSLAILAGGLLLSYLLVDIKPEVGKTLNAILFEKAAGDSATGKTFALIGIISEAVLLFAAAQTGFLGGPRVLSNMANDGWVPRRFARLSDRLVTTDGILFMGGVSLALLFISGGQLSFLIVLYSINVFLTFSLSLLGITRHWILERKNVLKWKSKLFFSLAGFLVSFFILLSVIFVKFKEGGYFTILITASFVLIAWLIRREYDRLRQLLRGLDDVGMHVITEIQRLSQKKKKAVATKKLTTGRTAIILVSGFHGIGLHTLFATIRHFPGYFNRFVFCSVGLVDAGHFKGVTEIERHKEVLSEELDHYVQYMKLQGFESEKKFILDTDLIDGVEKIIKETIKAYPESMVFAGRLLFEKENLFTRLLHTTDAYAIQKRLYVMGVPVCILPTRAEAGLKKY